MEHLLESVSTGGHNVMRSDDDKGVSSAIQPHDRVNVQSPDLRVVHILVHKGHRIVHRYG
jgi:hypothetical protein